MHMAIYSFFDIAHTFVYDIYKNERILYGKADKIGCKADCIEISNMHT